MQAVRLASPLRSSRGGSGDVVSVIITHTTPASVIKALQPQCFSTFSTFPSIYAARISNRKQIDCDKKKMRNSHVKALTSTMETPRHSLLQQRQHHCLHSGIIKPVVIESSRNISKSKRFVRTKAGAGGGVRKSQTKKKMKIKPKSMIKHIMTADKESDDTQEIEDYDSSNPKDDNPAQNSNDNNNNNNNNDKISTITYKTDEDFNRLNPLLYKRAPHRTFLPRTLLTMTTFHSAYWAWYVFDFIPAINANIPPDSTDLYGVDPTVGYVGLGLAIFMSVGSCVYPKYLISEIRSAYGTSGGLYIKTHDLPFITVPKGNNQGGKLYKRKEVTIDNNNDVTKILYDLDGDLRLFNGHLGLRSDDQKANLLLDIRQGEEEVLMEDVLLNSLLKDGIGKVPVKKRATNSVLQNANDNDDDDDDDENAKNRQQRLKIKEAQKRRQMQIRR